MEYLEETIENGTTNQSLRILNDLLDLKEIKIPSSAKAANTEAIVESRLRNKGLMKGLQGINLRDIPSFTHFLNKEETIKSNLQRIGVAYTEDKSRILMHPLFVLRSTVKKFLGGIFLERLIDLKS